MAKPSRPQTPWAMCPECSATMRGKECRKCGYTLDAPDRSGKAPNPVVCRCGSSLDFRGACAQTGHYPGWMDVQPFACPYCRKALAWSGACHACRGTRTPDDSETWTMPGGWYDMVGPHYVLVAKGPRPACSQEENVKAKRILMSVARFSAVRGMPEAVAQLGDTPALEAIEKMAETFKRHGGVPEEAWR